MKKTWESILVNNFPKCAESFWEYKQDRIFIHLGNLGISQFLDDNKILIGNFNDTNELLNGLKILENKL